MTTSDFRSLNASWRVTRTDRRTICSTSGHAFIASLQEVLANALRGPWGSYDGSHATRPVPDGNWGPITNAALWTYASLKGMSGATLTAIKSVAGTRQITLPVLQTALWLTYYQPRIIDRDVGGQREQSVAPAVEGTLPVPDAITFDAGTIPPVFGQRPAIPTTSGGLGASEPVCEPDIPQLVIPEGPDVAVPQLTTERTTTTESTSGDGGGFWLAVGAGVVIVAAKKKRRR